MQTHARTRDNVSRAVFVQSITGHCVPGYVVDVPINAAERAHPVTLICLQLQRNFRAKGVVASRLQMKRRPCPKARAQWAVMKRWLSCCNLSLVSGRENKKKIFQPPQCWQELLPSLSPAMAFLETLKSLAKLTVSLVTRSLAFSFRRHVFFDSSDEFPPFTLPTPMHRVPFRFQTISHNSRRFNSRATACVESLTTTKILSRRGECRNRIRLK